MVGQRAADLFFTRCQHHIGQAFAVQAQHLQVDELVDQARDARIELAAVRQKGHQHAHAELARDDLRGTHPQQHDVENAAEHGARQPVQDLQLLDAQRGIGFVDQQGLPCAAAHQLARKQLDGAHAPDGFQVVRGQRGAAHDLFFSGAGTAA
jgi:hypothetical protein